MDGLHPFAAGGGGCHHGRSVADAARWPKNGGDQCQFAVNAPGSVRGSLGTVQFARTVFAYLDGSAKEPSEWSGRSSKAFQLGGNTASRTIRRLPPMTPIVGRDPHPHVNSCEVGSD
jgi:hypothetical protein